MSISLFSNTPTVKVIDNQGLTIRDIAYYRHPDSPDVTDTRITRYQYDVRGFLTQSADPRLNHAGKVNFTYITDLSGNVLRTQGVDNGTTVVLNDAAGRPSITVSSIRTATDGTDDNSQAVAHIWQYEDASLPGRPLSIQEKTPDGTSHFTERFVYAGNTDAEKGLNLAGQCVSHYDTAGQVQTNSISLTGVPLSVTRRLLKDADNPDTVADWQGADASAWNELLAPEAFTTLTTLDATGAVLTTTDAKGNLQGVAYDVAGLLSGSWLVLTGKTKQIIVKSLTYSAAGLKLCEEHGNGVVTTYTYEAETQRLTGIKTERPTGHPSGARVLQDLRYEYDPVGNVLTISNDAEETRFWRNQKVVPANTYAYDSLYQLATASGREMANAGQQSSSLPTPAIPLPSDGSAFTNYSRSYLYDEAGNLTQISHSAPATGNSYTTDITISDRSNRGVLSTLTENPSDVEALFTAGGQQMQLQPGQSMVWTPRNELRKVMPVVRGGTEDDNESYRYDGSSQRLLKVSVQKISGGTQTQRVHYLPGLELRSKKNGDKQTESLQAITVGEAGRAQVRVLHWDSGKPDGLENDQLRYSYDNLTHSSQLELDGSGNVISMEEYYPYGGTSVWTVRSQAEADDKVVRYSGKERDATGLYYYGYRYYQPWAGRWLSADPAGAVDGLNLFRMVRNNPETLRDDNGLAPTKDDEKDSIMELKKLTIADPISDSSDTEEAVDPAPVKKIAFPDELKITLGELTLEKLPVGTTLYKAMRYASFDVELAISGQANKDEWEGQYFALDKEISEGYETDYLDEITGNGIAWLHTFEVTEEIPILNNIAHAHGSDAFSGDEKAAAIKHFLIDKSDFLDDEKIKEINQEKPLMPTLSRIGIAFNAPHDTDGGREIIIGGGLLKNIKVTHSESHKYKMWMKL